MRFELNIYRNILPNTLVFTDKWWHSPWSTHRRSPSRLQALGRPALRPFNAMPPPPRRTHLSPPCPPTPFANWVTSQFYCDLAMSPNGGSRQKLTDWLSGSPRNVTLTLTILQMVSTSSCSAVRKELLVLYFKPSYEVSTLSWILSGIDLGFNPGLSGVKPAASRAIHDTALLYSLLVFFGNLICSTVPAFWYWHAKYSVIITFRNFCFRFIFLFKSQLKTSETGIVRVS